MTRWLRWIAASALLLLALILAIGAVRMFAKDLPDATVVGGVFAAILALAAGVGAFFLVRPEFCGWTPPRLAEWLRFHPLGQALALYAASTVFMLAAPRFALLPAFAAICAFSAISTWTAATRPRWWANAILGVIAWLLLFGALMMTGEAIRKKSFGEDAMVLLLPTTAFPVLLVVSGVVHRMRQAGPRK